MGSQVGRSKDADDVAVRCWEQHCAAFHGKWDERVSLNSLSFHLDDYLERGLYLLCAVPKVSLAKLQEVLRECGWH